MNSGQDTLYYGISELAMPNRDEDSRSPVKVLKDAYLHVRDGLVIAVGERGQGGVRPSAHTVDLGARAVVPGLVDSHTHLVFAKDRIDEMARRARGETYEDIARAGGGIASSVLHVCAASEAELVAQALPRLQRMLQSGTTTCEIKSGYGLRAADELKMLRAIATLREKTAQSLRATALAHVIPQKFRHEPDTYVDMFCRDVIAAAYAAELVQHVDVFVEENAFTPKQAEVIAQTARCCALPLKLHVDQMRDGQGAALAARLGALSADHLEYTSTAGARALAAAHVTATILPGCAMFLGKGPWPGGRMLRDAGCEVAIATDCNPGSSMVSDLFMCGTLAITRCGLTMEEALWGVTRGGAKALGLQDRGTLNVGERADFVLLDHHDWRAAFYQVGHPPIVGVAIGGRWATPAQRV